MYLWISVSSTANGIEPTDNIALWNAFSENLSCSALFARGEEPRVRNVHGADVANTGFRGLRAKNA
jgi:hypothetical protein